MATATATAVATSTGTQGASATATATLSVTPTQTPTGGAVDIEIGTAVGQPGNTVGFAVTFTNTDRFQIVGIRNCIDSNATVPFARTGTGAPDCTVNAALQKPNSTFTFEPTGCTGANCDMCADIRGPQGTPVIPAGSMLYSCRVAIPGSTPDGTYPLGCGVGSATTLEGSTTRVDCEPGSVIVQTNLPGDCNGDGRVTIDELILGVNIALGSRPVTDCPAFDTDDSGMVSISELVAAVNVALNGP